MCHKICQKNVDNFASKIAYHKILNTNTRYSGWGGGQECDVKRSFLLFLTYFYVKMIKNKVRNKRGELERI